MAEYISKSKGFGDAANSIPFNTYVPELEEAADIRNALELFYFGNSEDGTTLGDVSLYATIVDFDARISANDSAFDGHTGAISDVHGTGAGNLVVGTGTVQTLTNKTLTGPKINENVVLTTTSTELNYVDGVTSSIQTQIDTNTPTGMISIYSASVAPTGWLLCDGSTYSTTTYANLFAAIGYTFGGTTGSFAVPNLKGRVVVGINAAQTEFDTLGEAGGSMTHQHASSNSGTTSVAHNHSIDPPSTTSSGAGDHGHSLTDHSHYSDHSHYADHSHSVNPGETTTSSSSHSHGGATNTNASNTTRTSGTGTVASSGHTHGIDSSSHSHTVNIATFTSANANGSGITTGNSNYGNTAGANALSTSTNSGNHSHSVDIAAFNTTGGEGGSHTHTTPASDTISNLQPYIALNYIIKI